MRGISPYVTIAASLAEATTHWDAVSELWVASGCTSLHTFAAVTVLNTSGNVGLSTAHCVLPASI